MDPDRWLSSRFIADREARADVVALYAFDHELARAPELASNALLAEIRLTWWREVLDQIYGGQPVRRHEVAKALALAVERRALPREPLEAAIDARIEAIGGDRIGGEIEAAAAIAHAAAIALDPAADLAAAALLGRGWRTAHAELLDPSDRSEMTDAARLISAAAFPAVAHAALRPTEASELVRRLRLTWAVARGRV